MIENRRSCERENKNQTEILPGVFIVFTRKRRPVNSGRRRRRDKYSLVNRAGSFSFGRRIYEHGPQAVSPIKSDDLCATRVVRRVK